MDVRMIRLFGKVRKEFSDGDAGDMIARWVGCDDRRLCCVVSDMKALLKGVAMRDCAGRLGYVQLAVLAGDEADLWSRA
jgi:hypothetical protein